MASGLGLNCFLMSVLWDIKSKWVNGLIKTGSIKNTKTLKCYWILDLSAHGIEGLGLFHCIDYSIVWYDTDMSLE